MLDHTLLGERVKFYRELEELTDQQLADKLGISKSFINSVENGFELPGLDLLFRMAECFEIGVDELLIDATSAPFDKDISDIISDDKELTELYNKIAVLSTERKKKFLKAVEFIEKMNDE